MLQAYPFPNAERQIMAAKKPKYGPTLPHRIIRSDKNLSNLIKAKRGDSNAN